MKTNKQITGRKGEDFAIKVLAKNGYRVIARNVKFDHYEIDILAIKNGAICFVEVKTREKIFDDSPTGLLDSRKKRALKVAAKRFLQIHGIQSHPYRIDMIAVENDENMDQYSYNLIEGAIDVDD